ncbi:thioesterase family protein [Thermomonospora catenispora]|uniref:thioesterase family protein n=1 Tax=Thermomonospora catenispora TaxID=2493090 RepID=UPI001120C455|nr:thioesterase family protein [Thermomonospora catenispora]TNY38340.1 thioesterase family protein [Thermomonospora catenispora]
MSRFRDATTVEKLAEGRYAADLDAGYDISGALNGGYVMAVLLRAAVDADPVHLHPVATSAAFLRVSKPGPAEITVEVRKTGRTATVSRVTLLQEGRPVVDAQVTTATLDADAEPDWAGEAPPPLPPIEQCIGPQPSETDRGFTDRVDMRFDPATMGWLDGQPSGRLEMRGYFRLRDDDYEPDAYLLAMAVDALPPVVLNTGALGWAPTVELTWHMRAVPAPGPISLYGGGRMVREGWFDEEVEAWDSAGRLVAQCRQIARVGRKNG